MKRKIVLIFFWIVVVILFFLFIAYGSGLRTPKWANEHPVPNPMLKK